jgi:Holliday junction resolvase RusA-like endonuclease
MLKINIKPLSVNKAWVGRRFKTPDYTKYERAVLLMLPKIKLPIAPYKLTIEYGFSNAASDIDNPNKLIIDIMQKKWKFDDKEIYELNTKKKIVKKGQEYFSFKIETL